MLFSVHTGIAIMLNAPAIALTPGEAHALAMATADVARHYEFLNGASQKVVDWTNLMVVLAMTYGPRVYTMQRDRAPQPPRGRQMAPAPAPNGAGGGAMATAAEPQLADLIPPGAYDA